MSLQTVQLMFSLMQPSIIFFAESSRIERRELNVQTRLMNQSFQQRTAQPMPYFRKQTHRRVGVSRRNNYYG
jgi:hypothetical protein